MNEKQIVFLTHMNRTGSTYLCNILDKYAKISVGIEGNFPDNLFIKCTEINNSESLKIYLDLLYIDKHFCDWNIDRNILETELLKAYTYPISFIDVIKTALKLYFNTNISEIYIHKAGVYIMYVDQILQKYPNVKMIYIYRDPRAVYNSLKKSKDINNKKMAVRPFGMIDQYKNYFVLEKKQRTNKNVHIIKYENLILNIEDEINKLLFFLNVNDKILKINSDKIYCEKIPKNQNHLHNNISKKPMHSRINAWKSELNNAEINYIQNNLRKEMNEYKYELIETKLSIKDYIIYSKLLYYNFFLKLKSKIKKQNAKI